MKALLILLLIFCIAASKGDSQTTIVIEDSSEIATNSVSPTSSTESTILDTTNTLSPISTSVLQDSDHSSSVTANVTDQPIMGTSTEFVLLVTSTLSSHSLTDSTESFSLSMKSDVTSSTSVMPSSSSISSSDSSTTTVQPNNTTSDNTSTVPSSNSSLIAPSTSQPQSTPSTSQPQSTSQTQPTLSTSQIQPTSSAPQPTASETPSPTPSEPPPQPVQKGFKISETNILLVRNKQTANAFVEISGEANKILDGLFLTVRNANKKADVKVLPLTGKLSAQGLYVVDKSQLDSIMPQPEELKSVVVALYSNEAHANDLTKDSLLDSLLLSVGPNVTDKEVAEVYNSDSGYNIYVLTSVLQLREGVSMSFCSVNDVSGFVLTSSTQDSQNDCDLTAMLPLQMKLNVAIEKKKCASSHLPDNFDCLLGETIVNKVNEGGQCGFTSLNLEDLNMGKIKTDCKKDNKKIAIRFHVRSQFQSQIDCIKSGYEKLVGDKTIQLGGQQYLVSNCSQVCFPNVLPSKHKDDKQIKVTIAVVSCIGIFLILLLVVIIFLKRKKRGLSQFRMTRLDEDDDLTGDMDDFVGNQGPTFSNYR